MTDNAPKLCLDHCTRCGRAAHASETNDDGVCVDCLGPDAIRPDSFTGTCDKCEGENDRADESNYCSRCSAEYQARIARDPETRPVGSS